jgi:hypothetical protein
LKAREELDAATSDFPGLNVLIQKYERKSAESPLHQAHVQLEGEKFYGSQIIGR